jgi:heme-degrading monooxygenase HmoA
LVTSFFLAQLLACTEPAYPDEKPLQNIAFQGPGWSSESGLIDPQPTYWAAVTMLEVADENAIRIRDHWTRVILKDIGEVPGHVGHRITVTEDGKPYGDNGLWARTYTVWQSEEALDAYVKSDLHLQGLKELGPHTGGFLSGRWEVEAEKIPEDWEDDDLWHRLEHR